LFIMRCVWNVCERRRASRSINSKSASVAMRRLMKDMEELSFQRFCARGTIVKIQKPQGEECQTTFTCAVTPAEGPFAHGTFEFIIQVPRTYPFSPPSVKCLNRVFHPNFDFRSGAVYLPILTDSWRPVLTMNTVIFSLQLLFLEPVSPTSQKDYSDTILNKDAYRLRQQCSEEYEQLVRATMKGGHFFGEQWVKTLRCADEHATGSVRKRTYSSTEPPQKRRRFADNISLSDLRYLSLNDSFGQNVKTTQVVAKSSTDDQNPTRKRSLDNSWNMWSSIKRRKRPSSVLDDHPPCIYLQNPNKFIGCDEECKQGPRIQPVMMDEDP